MLGQPLNIDKIKRGQVVTRKALADIEDRLTKNTFLCGGEKTLADVSACQEMYSGIMVNLDLSKYPNIQRWLTVMIDKDPINYKLNEKTRMMAPNMQKWLKKQKNYPKL